MGYFLKAYAEFFLEYPGTCLLYTVEGVIFVLATIYIVKTVFADEDDQRPSRSRRA